MYIVVCDDDPIFLSSMEVRIRNFFTHRSLKCPTVSLFQNGDELLKSGITPDIAFLDVEMPGRSGIHVGAELMQKTRMLRSLLSLHSPIISMKQWISMFIGIYPNLLTKTDFAAACRRR